MSPNGKAGAVALGKRLDTSLVERGLAPSREKARAMILAGQVTVDGQVAGKAGRKVFHHNRVAVKGGEMPFVGRGGLKLEGALDSFGVSVEGEVAIDVGASTGGFTDCLLQRGAARVYAVDVGYGQLAWKLQTDPRVIRLDRTNIRKIDPEEFPEKCGLAVVDTSFISLKMVLPPTIELLREKAQIISLVKPQFEVGRGKVGKGGVVKDPELQREVLREMIAFAGRSGLKVRRWRESSIRGAAGNREFLLLLGKGDWSDRKEQIVEEIGRWAPADL